MVDDFRAYRAVTPPGGVMDALPEEGESWSPEMEYLGRTSDTSFRDKPPYKVAIDPNGAVIENLPKDFYLNRTPGENVADILRRAFENGAFKNSPRLDNLASGGQMLFEMIPGVAEANTKKAFERGDYGQAALEALGTIPGGKLVGTALGAAGTKLAMAFGPRIFSGKLADEAAGATEEGIASLRLNTPPDPNKPLRQELQTIGPDKMYSQAEKVMMEFPKAKAKWKDIRAYLLKSKNGVKKEELDYAGLNFGGEEVVSREEVIEKLRAGQPRIEIGTGDGWEYQQYTMPGGENFQQDLIRVRPKNPSNAPTFEEFRKLMGQDYRNNFMRNNPGQELDERLVQYLDEVENGGSPSTDAMLQVEYGRYLDRLADENPRYRARHFTGENQNVDLALHVLRKDENIPSPEGGPDIKRRRIEEFQSDKATDYRRFLEVKERARSYLPRLTDPQERATALTNLENRKFDTDPYTMDDKWVTLGVKTSLAKAAEDGVDEILLAPPEVITKRWRGADEKAIQKLDTFYRKELPAEFENWVTRMGGKKGELVEIEKAGRPDFSGRLTEYLGDDNNTEELTALFDELGADTDYAEDIYEKIDQSASTLEGIDPSKRADWIDSNIRGKREEYNKLKNRLDKLRSSENAKTMSPEELDQEEDMLFEDIVVAERDLHAAMMLPKALKGAGVDYTKAGLEPVKAYVIKLTPEVRKRILEELMPRMAKGGIVDIAKYWLYDTDK